MIRMRNLLVATVILWSTIVSTGLAAPVVLTVAEARARALRYNRYYLSAQEDLNKAKTEITSARAGILPEVSVSGGYVRGLKIPSMFIYSDTGNMEFTTSLKNQFSAGILVKQPIWEGGKALNAWAIARQYRQYSEDSLRAVEAGILYRADLLYYGSILRQSTLEVLNKSLEANTENLSVVEKMYSKGVVSQYELLRAKVERSNLLPQIMQAESDLRLAESHLKSFLGLSLSDTVQLIADSNDTTLAHIPTVDSLEQTALRLRPEMQAAEHLLNITRRAVSVAKGDYWPTLDAYTSYNWQSQSNSFQLDKNQTKSWTAGLNLHIPIFNGFKTAAAVAYRKADNRKSRLFVDQLRDDITLEVQQAYDRLIQAKKSLEVQHETIAQAEEGLKISKVRYQSGVGTQLEVLSAQAALTEARRALASALFNFRDAKSGLKKATTIDLDAL